MNMKKYSRPATIVAISLTLGCSLIAAQGSRNRNFVAHLSGDQEVPPRDTQAQGQAIFQLSDDGTELHYKLIVANIENVVAAHIHLGAIGQNGPVVAFLFGPAPPGGGRTDGVLAEGTITAADVIPPAAQ